MTNRDRLDTLEASHVALMTDFELFVKEHEKRVAEQDAEWERSKERWRQFDTWREQEYKRQIQRDIETDRRIRDLVTAVGKLIEIKS
jgi:hypothetical protein